MRYQFAQFELDDARYELRCSGQLVRLEPRVFNLLALLVRNSDRVVTKDEIVDRVWSGRVVSEGSVSVAVAAARKAVGDDGLRQEIIRTSIGRGYQLALPAVAASNGPADTSLDKKPRDFVGRSEELNLFSALLDHDASATLLVSGEPGIGKSRLLVEYASIAALRATPMHIVHCPESERTPFLWPCVELIERLAAETDFDWRASLHESHAAFLSALLPQLFSIAPRQLASDPDAASFQLFESLAAAFHVLCRNKRHLVAIDDFHRSDAASARFLQFLVELRDLPFSLIVAYRPVEAARAPLHSSALLALARASHSQSVALRGLSPAETSELASNLSGGPTTAFSAEALRDHTGGNPFFIKQLIPLLTKHGPTGHWADAPPSVSQLIRERVAMLDSETQSMLAAASVIGREFSLALLRAIVAPMELDSSIAEAVSSGLVIASQHEQNVFSFQHVLVRDVLYRQLPAEDRRALHRRLARALDATSRFEGSLATIAHHFAQAGSRADLGRALMISQQAAIAAQRRSAHEDAIHHLHVALDALSTVAPADQRLLCRLLLQLGEAECRAGQRSAARSTLREAATLARGLGSSQDLARAALGVAPGFLAAEAGVFDAYLAEVLAEAMAAISSTNARLQAQIAARLAMTLHWAERDRQMLELLSVARSCLARDPDRHIQMYLLFAEWFCEWSPGETPRRAAIAEEICSLAHELCDREMYLVGSMLRMVALLEGAQLASFDIALANFETLAERLRQPQSLWYASMYRAMRCLLEGELAEVAVLQSEYTKIAARVGDANAFHSVAAQSALVRWETGTLDQMIGGIAEGARRYPAIRGFRAGLAWAHVKLGQIEEARREYERVASGNFRDLPNRYDWSTAIPLAAEVCTDLCDQPRASVLYRALKPLEGQMLVFGLGVASYGSADRLLALLSATLGRLEQAEWHFRKALEVTDARMPLWSIHTKLDYAAFLNRHRRSSRGVAVGLVSEAREASLRIDARALAHRAEQVLSAVRV